MKVYKKISSGIHQICRFFSWVAALALFVMMALTFFDVVGRYVFNSPIIGTMDIVEQLMVVVVFSVLGHVTLNRAHIRADVLNPILSTRKYCILSAISFFIAAIPVFFMAYQTTIEAWKTILNPKLSTAVLAWPLFPFYIIAAIGLILLFLEIIFDIVNYLTEAKTCKIEEIKITGF